MYRCDRAPRPRSATSSSPPRLPQGFLSATAARCACTAAACSPTTAQPLPPHSARPHLPDCCRRLYRKHRSPGAPHAPYRQGPGSHPAALPSSFSTVTAQLDPAVQCSARPPICQVLLKALLQRCFKAGAALQGMPGMHWHTLPIQQ
jgi:hypothetical protein